MAKKKANSTVDLVKKLVAVLASVVTFVFFFMESMALKVSTPNIISGGYSTATEPVKLSDLLFNDDSVYEVIRETYSLATIVMWVSLVLVAVAIVATIYGLVASKNGAKFSKLGAVALLVGVVALFAVNFDVTTNVLKVETNISNLTTLYFVSLGLSVVGLGATATLKK